MNNLQGAIRKITELDERLAVAEAKIAKYNNRFVRLENVWNRFRKDHNVPRHVTKNLKIPPRPKCLKVLGLGHDPVEEVNDEG